MLLNTEELLALVNGDVEPDRLADLLDRLEHCPDSAAALQVLVTLRANREEALEALRTAAEAEPIPAIGFPHPAARKMALSGWGLQGLRMAASFALIALIGIWALGSPISLFVAEQPIDVAEQPVDFASLATTKYENILTVNSDVERTAANESETHEAGRLLDDRDFVAARKLLETLDSDDTKAVLYLAMSQYWLSDYGAAALTFERLHGRPIDDYGVKMQVLWYEANTMLQAGRPVEALLKLEKLAAQLPSASFQPEAMAKHAEVSELLGLNVSGSESGRER